MPKLFYRGGTGESQALVKEHNTSYCKLYTDLCNFFRFSTLPGMEAATANTPKVARPIPSF